MLPVDNTSTDSNDSTATVIETDPLANITNDFSANKISSTSNDVSSTNNASSTNTSPTKTVLHAANMKDSVSMKSLETSSVEDDIETERLKNLVPGNLPSKQFFMMRSFKVLHLKEEMF